MRAVFKWVNIFLTIGVFFVALGIIYVAVPYFGNQALIVRSGSMSPAIDAGSIVVVRPEIELITPQGNKIAKYNNNDIIAFRSENNPNTIITHRVVGSEIKETGVFYKTKGDANKSVDGWAVNEQNVLGKTYFTLPYFGHILAFAKSSLGFPLLIVLPAILVVLFEVYNIIKEIRKNLKSSAKPGTSQHLAKLNPGGLNVTSLKVLIPLLIIGLSVPIAFAFPSDTEKSANNVFTAAKVFSNSPSATPTPTPTLSEIANHAVISEVQIATSGATTSDFIEFYNPTSSPFDLDGHRLVKRTSSSSSDTTIKSWTSSAIIPAHGFYLWASSDGGYGASIGADTSTSENISASNSIALRSGAEDTGTIIDALSWNSDLGSLKEGTEFSPNPGANESMERKALSTSDADSMTSGADVSKGNGFDSDDNSVDFILRTLSQPQNSGSVTESP